MFERTQAGCRSVDQASIRQCGWLQQMWLHSSVAMQTLSPLNWLYSCRFFPPSWSSASDLAHWLTVSILDCTTILCLEHFQESTESGELEPAQKSNGFLAVVCFTEVTGSDLLPFGSICLGSNFAPINQQVSRDCCKVQKEWVQAVCRISWRIIMPYQQVSEISTENDKSLHSARSLHL